MKTPEVAARIHEIAGEISGEFSGLATELHNLADELRRRPPTVRSAATSSRMTPELKGKIQEYAEEHPHLSYQTMARKFNVNQGRVSEALRGKRR